MRKFIVLASVQGIIFLVLLEIVGRIFDPVGISYYDETARLFDSLVRDEPLGYRFPPGLKDSFNGVDVDINELGMRDAEVAAEKPDSETRILAMGDSVIFSVGVESQDSIPVRLQAMVNENTTNGRNFRILNMGVPSYNTVQQLEQLKQVGLDLQPDAVFLLTVPNDIQDRLWVYNKRSNPIVDAVQRSYAIGLVFFTLRSIALATGLTSNASQAVLDDESTNNDSGAQLELKGWRDIENSLIEINRILKDRDIPFLLFYRSQFGDTFKQRFRELGQRESFATRELNIFDDPRWEDLDKSEYVNSPVDSHCNAAGCQLYATAIYEGLAEAGLIN